MRKVVGKKQKEEENERKMSEDNNADLNMVLEMLVDIHIIMGKAEGLY